MRRSLLIVVACVGLLCLYVYALVWLVGYAAGLGPPNGWRDLFPSRVSGSLSWLILVNTVAMVLVSIPVALLVARFAGRRATTVALLMSLALFVVLGVPSLVTDFGTIMTPRIRLVTAFDYIKLVGILPLLVWLLRKLPSNNRWRGP